MVGPRAPLPWLLAAAFALGGCETQSAALVPGPPPTASSRVVRVDPCQDRTGTASRDLVTEGTRTLTEKVKASGLFEVSADAPLVLTCDIEQFAEGSAFKRWLMPGYGTTRAQVAVALWEKAGDKMLGAFRSHSQVQAGGLYTVGADQYILGAAFDDVIHQLREWLHRS